MANERRNERMKLMSGWCNATSVAMVTLGTMAPIIGSVYDWFKVADPAKPLVGNWQIPVCWLMFGIVIHGLGHMFLEGIVETELAEDAG